MVFVYEYVKQIYKDMKFLATIYFPTFNRSRDIVMAVTFFNLGTLIYIYLDTDLTIVPFSSTLYTFYSRFPNTRQNIYA